jgi:hypothetical protein
MFSTTLSSMAELLSTRHLVSSKGIGAAEVPSPNTFTIHRMGFMMISIMVVSALGCRVNLSEKAQHPDVMLTSVTPFVLVTR